MLPSAHLQPDSSHFLHHFVDTIAAPVFVKDRQHRWVLVNQAFCQLVKLESAAMLGKTDYDFLPAAQADRYREANEIAFTTGFTQESEETLTDAEGKTFTVSVQRALLQDEQGNQLLVCTIQNVTHYKQIETDLRQSKQLLQLVMDNIPEYIFWKDHNSVFLGCNLNFAQFSGCKSPEEVVGKTDYDLSIHFGDAIKYREDDQRIMQADHPVIGVMATYQQPDGEQRWLETNKFPLHDGEGKVIGILGTFTDVTEQHQIRLMQEQQLAAIEAASDGIAILQDEKYIYMNQAHVQIFGYHSADSLIGQNWRIFYQPEVIQRFEQEVFPVLQQQRHWRGETIAKRADGSQFFQEVFLTLTESNTLICTCRNITERKQAELLLQEREARFSSILDTVPSMIWMTNPGAETVYVNRTLSNFTGQSAEQNLGLGWLEQVHPDDFAQTLATIETAFGNQLPLDVECRMRRADGQYRWLLTKGAPRYEAEQYVGYVGTCIDISDRKQAEMQIRESQKLLQLVIDNLPQIIIWKDRSSVYLGANRKTAEVAGLSSAAELIGKTDYDLPWTPEQTEWYRECDRRVMESGQAELGIIETQRQADGSLTWQETNKIPLRDEQGSVIAVVITAEDITLKKQAEAKLRQLNEELEQHVAERTAQLSQLVAQLKQEVTERQQVEKQLRESQQLLQMVMNTIPQLIFWKDRNSVYLGCNQNGAKIAGFASPEQIVGRTDYEMPWTLEQAEWYRACDQRVIESGEADLHIIETQRQADGRQAWLDTNKVPLRDEQGTVIGILVTIEDITDRKAVEQAVVESETRFRTIIENANDTICMLSPEGQFVYMSPNWESLLGYTITETLNQHFEPLIHPEDLLHCLKAFGLVVSGEAAATVVQYRAVHRDGSLRWHTTNLSSIRDVDGQVQHCIAIMRDDTVRKAAEATLRQQEQFLRSIYDGVAHPIFVVDVLNEQEFYLADWNQFTERNLNLPASEVAGKPMVETIFGSRGSLVQQRFKQCITTEQPVTYEEWLTISGKISWWQTTLNPLRNQAGEIYQIVGTTFEITDRKVAEAQLQQQARDLELALQELQRTQIQMVQSEKMSSLGQLVAGVAHEINNPVNFIYGNLSYAETYARNLLGLVQLYQEHYPNPAAVIQTETDAIELDFLQEDLPKLLHSMRMGAERIQKIVASLRTFSRMDEAESKAVDVHEGIESTLMILQNRLKAKGARPEIQLVRTYGQLPRVECYAGQLNQVLMNILSNAIDAVEERFEQTSGFLPQITICTAMLESDQVNIRITDNGIGMPEPVQQRIFDPFFTTKPVGKGTGMGMSISYQIIVEKHKGALHCVSRPEQGTEFSITIPIRIEC